MNVPYHLELNLSDTSNQYIPSRDQPIPHQGISTCAMPNVPVPMLSENGDTICSIMLKEHPLPLDMGGVEESRLPSRAWRGM